MNFCVTETDPTKLEGVRSFMEEYFDAWKGTDENAILAYFSDNVLLRLPFGILEGKVAVRDNFVRPFITAFPGNVHAIVNLAYGHSMVAVKWSLEAIHKGVLGETPASGRLVKVLGCSFYGYDLSIRIIRAGRIYFDFA